MTLDSQWTCQEPGSVVLNHSRVQSWRDSPDSQPGDRPGPWLCCPLTLLACPVPLASGAVLAPRHLCRGAITAPAPAVTRARHAQGPQTTQGRSHPAARREELEGQTATGEVSVPAHAVPSRRGTIFRPHPGTCACLCQMRVADGRLDGLISAKPLRGPGT